MENERIRMIITALVFFYLFVTIPVLLPVPQSHQTVYTYFLIKKKHTCKEKSSNILL